MTTVAGAILFLKISISNLSQLSNRRLNNLSRYPIRGENRLIITYVDNAMLHSKPTPKFFKERRIFFTITVWQRNEVNQIESLIALKRWNNRGVVEYGVWLQIAIQNCGARALTKIGQTIPHKILKHFKRTASTQFVEEVETIPTGNKNTGASHNTRAELLRRIDLPEIDELNLVTE